MKRNFGDQHEVNVIFTLTQLVTFLLLYVSILVGYVSSVLLNISESKLNSEWMLLFLFTIISLFRFLVNGTLLKANSINKKALFKLNIVVLIINETIIGVLFNEIVGFESLSSLLLFLILFFCYLSIPIITYANYCKLNKGKGLKQVSRLLMLLMLLTYVFAVATHQNWLALNLVIGGLCLFLVRNIMEYAIPNAVQFLLSHESNKVKQALNTDVLTDIGNRRAFYEAYDEYREKIDIEEAMSHKGLWVCYADIDYFKKYNDSYGHLSGDKCLVTVTKVINHWAEKFKGACYRLGGEEFVVLIKADDTMVKEIEQDIMRNHWHELFSIKQIEHTKSPFGVVTLSAGAMFFDDTKIYHMNAKSVLDEVDKKMYQVKKTTKAKIML
jgi:diguanylate cyclase (GGDEF)-like protein